MPDKRPSVKNEDQYEALKEKGMSKARAARIANSPEASRRGGKKSGSGTRRRTSSQGGTTAQPPCEPTRSPRLLGLPPAVVDCPPGWREGSTR
jgi:hypothetical protein